MEGSINALQKINELKKKLESKGVNDDNLEEVLDLLMEYREAQQAVEQERCKQFWYDAHEIATKIKAANKVDELSQFLRHFAEHIAKYAKEAQYEDRVEDIVDSIPLMYVKEE
jgi:hypothetical protein